MKRPHSVSVTDITVSVQEGLFFWKDGQTTLHIARMFGFLSSVAVDSVVSKISCLSGKAGMLFLTMPLARSSSLVSAVLEGQYNSALFHPRLCHCLLGEIDTVEHTILNCLEYGKI